MTQSPAEPGLRERKRLATRRSIQHAVLSLTAERGFDRFTIEDVGRAADVSPRTFFNYFASKDEALIGDIPRVPDGELVENFVTGVDGRSILAGLGEVFARSAETSAVDDREMQVLRKAVFRDHPHLMGLRMATMRVFEEELHAVVLRRLEHDLAVAAEPGADPDAGPSGADPSGAGSADERAWMLTLVGFATMRHAWRLWADNDASGALGDRIRRSFAQLPAVLD